jgi:hypothetical protein
VPTTGGRGGGKPVGGPGPDYAVYVFAFLGSIIISLGTIIIFLGTIIIFRLYTLTFKNHASYI